VSKEENFAKALLNKLIPMISKVFAFACFRICNAQVRGSNPRGGSSLKD